MYVGFFFHHCTEPKARQLHKQPKRSSIHSFSQPRKTILSTLHKILSKNMNISSFHQCTKPSLAYLQLSNNYQCYSHNTSYSRFHHQNRYQYGSAFSWDKIFLSRQWDGSLPLRFGISSSFKLEDQ